MKRLPARALSALPALVLFLLAALLLSVCDQFNAPVKDDMEFYMKMTPVSSWEELRREVEEGSGGLLVLKQSFSPPDYGAAIEVRRAVTIAALDGTQTITRAEFFTVPFFELYDGGHLTLGYPRRAATLVLDGNNVLTMASVLVESAVTNPAGANPRFTLERGAELRNNIGGGVSLRGTMIMTGGSISGMTVNSNDGGGVWLNGTMTMTGGSISGNSSDQDGGGVYLADNSRFKMTGGTIGGNDALSGSGGGVYLRGTMNMSGGDISDNETPHSGGGVYISYNSTMNMSGGSINDNKARNANGLTNGRGGGVYNGGTFTMSGGSINNNHAIDSGYSTYGNGGGVYNAGTFSMTDGEVHGNTADPQGGGIYSSDGTVIIQGGRISANTVSNERTDSYCSGGGIFFSGGGPTDTLEIRAGSVIENNTVSNTVPADVSPGGGGICVVGLTCEFNMFGGTIRGNSVYGTNKRGGGVYVETGTDGTFDKTGGVIYGSNEPDDIANKAGGDGTLPGKGHAVFWGNAGNEKYRDTTAGRGTGISTSPLSGWDE